MSNKPRVVSVDIDGTLVSAALDEAGADHAVASLSDPAAAFSEEG